MTELLDLISSDGFVETSHGALFLLGFCFALPYEAATLAFRFGLGMRACTTFARFAPWTFNIRVHHGYVGAVLLVAAFWLDPSLGRSALMIAGWSMLLSDLAHHFIFLWWLTGSPQFDLRYPKS